MDFFQAGLQNELSAALRTLFSAGATVVDGTLYFEPWKNSVPEVWVVSRPLDHRDYDEISLVNGPYYALQEFAHAYKAGMLNLRLLQWGPPINVRFRTHWDIEKHLYGDPKLGNEPQLRNSFTMNSGNDLSWNRFNLRSGGHIYRGHTGVFLPLKFPRLRQEFSESGGLPFGVAA
jgi:hypothetical protein